MYSKLEIIKIFNRVKNWDELQVVCDSFKYLFDMVPEFKKNIDFVKDVSNYTFKRIENI